MDIKQLEKALMRHLEESGEIRTDIKWLKRSFWAFAAGAISFNFSVIAYLVLRQN